MKFKMLGLLTIAALGLALSSCEVKFVSSLDNIEEETGSGESGGSSESGTGESGGSSESGSESGTTEGDSTETEVKTYDYYGYKDLERYENKTSCQSFYNDIVSKCNTFLTSTVDVEASNYVLPDETVVSLYEFDTAEYTKYSLSLNEAVSIYKLVMYDHTEFYWLSGSILSTSSNGTSSIVLSISEDYKLSETRIANKTALDNFVNAISDNIKAATDDKVKLGIIHDYIIEKATYAKKSDDTPETADWAHNLIGIPLYGKGVCECYSELFSYMCRVYNLNAILVTGTGTTSSGSDNHAWNYIQINDVWYPIDVTWDDTTNSNNYFCIDANTFNKDHVAATSKDLDANINYIYALPTLSETALS